MADPTSPANGNPGQASGPALGTTTTGTERSSLGDARNHLGKAASAAGDSLRGAGRAARDELRQGSEGIRAELGELAATGRAAALDARDLADEKLQDLMDQGREFLASAERMVREKPLQAVGIAALAGFIIAKLR
jgi:ElaB/YqjD/DUF883 family membrane-anchored ribosome-binding protein